MGREDREAVPHPLAPISGSALPLVPAGMLRRSFAAGGLARIEDRETRP